MADATDNEITDPIARNIVNNHRFDIGGNVAKYWMNRCDRAEADNRRLVRILAEHDRNDQGFKDFETMRRPGTRWIAADGGKYGYIVEGDDNVDDLIVRGFKAGPDDEDVPSTETATINYFNVRIDSLLAAISADKRLEAAERIVKAAVEMREATPQHEPVMGCCDACWAYLAFDGVAGRAAFDRAAGEGGE